MLLKCYLEEITARKSSKNRIIMKYKYPISILERRYKNKLNIYEKATFVKNIADKHASMVCKLTLSPWIKRK